MAEGRADVLDEVLGRARELGFLGPGPVAEQRRHAEAFLTAIELAGVERAVDLGSGGGVPGLVLAVALPDVAWTLVDAMRRRTTFLEEAVERLGLGERVTVRNERGEATGRSALRAGLDLVVARGFGPPPVVIECGAPLLRVGGQLVVSEPPGSAGERWPGADVADLGMVVEAVVQGPPSFVRLRQVSLASPTFPRRNGLPAKRPLW